MAGFWGKVLPMALDYATRIPYEKLIIKPPDKTARVKELQQIFREDQGNKATEAPPEKVEPVEPVEEEEPGIVRSPARQKPMISDVTLQETIDYQKKEIAKLLLLMERHYAQGLRIAGRVCDCGGQKHLLDIEALAQETIPMVKEGGIYQKLVDWVNAVGPETTVEAVSSGEFDNDYPIFSGQARDFRKEIMGTLDVKSLFNGPSKSPFAGYKVKVAKPETEEIMAAPEELALPEPENTPAAEGTTATLPTSVEQPIDNG